MPDTQNLPFGNLDFSIVSTENVAAEDLENFLNSDPNDITLKGKDAPEKTEKAPKSTQEPVVKKTPKTPLKEESEDTDDEKEIVVGGEDVDALNEILGSEDDEEESTEDVYDSGSSETTTTDDNVYNNLSNDLLNLGIFNLYEGEEALDIDSPEKFKERFVLEAQNKASEVIEKYVSRYGEEYEKMFESVFVQGVDPQTYLQSYNKLENIASLDLNDEDVQERLVKESLKAEGRNDEYIKKRIQKIKDYGELEDEAKDAQTYLVQKEQEFLASETERVAEAAEQKKRLKQEYVTTVSRILGEKLKTKEFDGIPLDRKMAENVGKYITHEAYKLGNETLTEFDKDLLDLKKPANYEKRVKVALLLKTMNEDPTLSKLKEKIVSQKTDKLFSKVEQATRNKGGKTPEKTRSNFFS